MLQEQADIRFSAAGTPELTQTCQQFGQVYSCSAFPERYYATGKGLEVATVGKQATATLHAIDANSKECEQPLVNTSCELVSDAGGPIVKVAVQKEKNEYTINYQLTHRGRYQLHIKVEGIATHQMKSIYCDCSEELQHTQNHWRCQHTLGCGSQPERRDDSG